MVASVSSPDLSAPAAVVPILVELIAGKRDGGALSKAEIGRMVSTAGVIDVFRINEFSLDAYDRLERTARW